MMAAVAVMVHSENLVEKQKHSLAVVLWETKSTWSPKHRGHVLSTTGEKQQLDDSA
jgi:hypothetical protein